jgi:hypothetical protein
MLCEVDAKQAVEQDKRCDLSYHTRQKCDEQNEYKKRSHQADEESDKLERAQDPNAANQAACAEQRKNCQALGCTGFSQKSSRSKSQSKCRHARRISKRKSADT